MQLLTPELLARFAEVGRQDKPDAVVVAKYFDPCSAATWYATEYDPEDECFFGLADLYNDGGELGYFSLAELSMYRGPFGIGIERDLWWTETPLDAVRAAREPQDLAEAA